ncbi:GroES-like protein [Dendrothele bispora CBS 962.96]|uniref:GroES-like protein n=1 Tax=Dendrothele bispora (strain CBS 962.96) TaxID=1314807 RepID=A0A4S8MQP4_DENBC|nr:GroES-like protein [Dendrothele bispora CBS 962.96]
MAQNGTHTNYACVLTAPGTVEVQDLSVPSVGPEDVLVKVEATGICGSDLHLYNHFGIGKFRITKPSVLGHESAGTIVKIGEKVKDRAVGDRVCIEPTMFCRKCFNCKAGRPNICREVRQAGLAPTTGTLSQYYVCESDFTVKIPDSLPWLEAGCIQPLAISVQIAKRAKFTPGQTLAVFGCGPLGALVMATAKAYGLSKILAFDISQKRVEFATQHWAHYGAISPAKQESQDYESWADEFKTKTMKEAGIESWGVDVVVEASGAEPCMHAGIGFLRPGGTYVAAGLGRAINSFPTVQIVGKELDVVGSVRYTAGCFQTAIDLASSGKVDLKPLVTASFPLSKSAEALEAVRKGEDLKVVIMNQEL